MEKIILNLALPFILGRLQKFQSSINWTTVETDLEAKIRAVIPGQWLDDAAIDIMRTVMGYVQKAMADQADIKSLLGLLAAGNYQGALTMLKNLITSSLSIAQLQDPSSAQVISALA